MNEGRRNRMTPDLLRARRSPLLQGALAKTVGVLLLLLAPLLVTGCKSEARHREEVAKQLAEQVISENSNQLLQRDSESGLASVSLPKKSFAKTASSETWMGSAVLKNGTDLSLAYSEQDQRAEVAISYRQPDPRFVGNASRSLKPGPAVSQGSVPGKEIESRAQVLVQTLLKRKGYKDLTVTTVELAKKEPEKDSDGGRSWTATAKYNDGDSDEISVRITDENQMIIVLRNPPPGTEPLSWVQGETKK